ncbi:aromatic ring-hydroxylating oxygenase subunit alpha [Roseomonas sp. BN140053]|uniref:aromatic ring-hydroxylating oxygenase subunit alpha n=1 Tax=Roseomonas sp. BN140053 TaxID=3391898 RepID=UPI0039E873D1
MADDALRELVAEGRVSGRVYTDPAVFELEMERLFGRLWLFVAHESQLRRPGDFVRSQLARHEVIVTRGNDGAIHVLHNRCSHRGARLCMTDRGNARRIVCPYHAWVFRPDGSLANVPHAESYPPGFDLEAEGNRLRRVPRVDSYRGFVFASLAEDGPPLREHLGEMAAAIDNLVDRAPNGEVELAAASFSIEYRGNWKFHNENAADIFHPGFVHSSSVGTAMSAPEGACTLDADQTREMMLANGFGRSQWEGIQLTGLPGGHSFMGGFYRKGVLAQQTVDDATRRYREALAAARGAERAEEILSVNRFNNLIFPNLNLNAQFQQMRLVLPLAVDRTLIRISCFRLGGAPEEIFHRAVRFLTALGSPASMIYSDDVEMLERCQEGLSADPGLWLNFERGQHSDARDAAGRLTGTASELPMRAQFAAWAEHMRAAA